MYPFIWSKGGGSQESVKVVEFMEMTERLRGGALGTESRKTIPKHLMSRGTYVPCECKGLHASNTEALTSTMN